MVAFVSIGCNTILKCVPWKRGDEILASNFTFGANVNACRNVAEAIKGDEFNPWFSWKIILFFNYFSIFFHLQENFISLKYVFPSVTRRKLSKVWRHIWIISRRFDWFCWVYSTVLSIGCDSCNACFSSLFSWFHRSGFCFWDHISSPSALVLPLREMIAECRKRRVLVMVDGAHAVGQLSINLEDLGADFYFGSCSKWLYTPRGCAVLWVAEEHQKWCTPLIISLKHRTGFHSEFRCQGTRDNVPYLAVPEAIQFLEDIGGLVIPF